jgi:hypothetical protein
VRFGCDGVFPFDCQSNILTALTGVWNKNGYLPPSKCPVARLAPFLSPSHLPSLPDTDVIIRLHKRSPVTALLDLPEVPEEAYWRDTAATAKAYNHVTFDFVKLRLMYEWISLPDKKMRKIEKRGFRYLSDVPRVLASTVEGKIMQTTNTVVIPKGTKVFTLTWMKTQQLFYKATHNKPLSARFRFPPNATRVAFEIEGMGSLFFERGFDQIGTAMSYNSETSRWYWNHLTEKRLYDKPYEDLFPKDPANNHSFDSVFLFDFTEKANMFPQDTTMTVRVDYDDQMAPPHWYLVQCSISQYEFWIKPKEPVSYRLIL